MIRSFLLLGLYLTLACVTTQAQDFTLRADTVRKDNVPGTANHCDYSYELSNYMRNETNAPFPIKWVLIEKNLPATWLLCGICDNKLCRDTGNAALKAFAPDETNPVPVGDSSLMKAMILVPASSPPGIGIVKVKVYTPATTDTATFIVTKIATGISTIAINDNRVSLFPNPAVNDLTVFTDKSLKAVRIELVDIRGASQMVQQIGKDADVSRVDIHALAAGLYLVKITDAGGAVITTRKFSKQ